MPCDRPGLEAERVCLLPQDGSLLCDTPAALQRRGAWIHAGQVVAGFAPAGARWVEVRVEGSNNVTLIVVENGVFGAVLDGASPGATLDLRFS